MWDQRGEISGDLLINSTPIGMKGKWELNCPYPVEKLDRFIYVYDMVYNPIETKLIKAAKEFDLNWIPGVNMFVYQGLKQFEIWTNKKIEFNDALSLIREYL